MKKNVISKILLALVIVALVSALWACSKKDDTPSGGGGLTAPVLDVKGTEVTWDKVGGAVEYGYTITDAEGKEVKTDKTKQKTLTIEPGQSVVVWAIDKGGNKGPVSNKVTASDTVQTQLIKIVKGINGYTNILSNTANNQTLSADVAVGGWFNDAEDVKRSLSLGVQANARSTDPEFMIDFKLKGKDDQNEVPYVTLGYKDGKIYVREPGNFINTDETVADAFYIDVTTLKPTVNALMAYVMNLIEKKVSIDFNNITDTVESILTGLPMDLGTIINLDDKSVPNQVSLGVKVGALGLALDALGGMQIGKEGNKKAISALVNEYIKKAQDALDSASFIKEKLPEGLITVIDELSWDKIKKVIGAAPDLLKAMQALGKEVDDSLISIVIDQNANKDLTGLSLQINLGALGLEKLQYKAGLDIGLTTFSNNSVVTINAPSGFGKKDLAINLNGKLPMKGNGLEANIDAVVRLSDALAAADNKWGTAVVTVNGSKSYAYIDAKGAYVDFGGIYTALGVTGVQSTFKQYYETDEQGNNPVNVITKLNTFVANWSAEQIAAIEPAAAAPRTWEEYKFNMDDIINGVKAAANGGINGILDYASNYVYNNFVTIIDATVNEKATAKQGDLIDWAFNYKIGPAEVQVINYVKFYFTNGQDKTFNNLIDNIKACHAEGVETLTESIHTDTKTAGIQLIGTENSLLAYLSYFVKIPTIVEGNEGKEISWTETAEITDTTALKGWLDFVLPEGNEGREIAEDIITSDTTFKLTDIIDSLYVEAVGGTGLEGSVKAAPTADADKAYVELGGSIKLAASEDAPAMNIDIASANTFTSQEGGEYVIATAGKAMLNALRAY